MKNQIPISPKFSFDKGYYRKYYEDPATRVADTSSCAALADFIFAYLKYLEIPISRVLDIGCGTGLWRQEVRRLVPSAQYIGVEKSSYACRKYGWEQGCLTTFRSAEAFDLVICSDVLQYLSETEAEAAMRNLTKLVRGAVYLKILTLDDWEHNCDRTITDGHVYLRRASWYRERLSRNFLACGGGVFLKKDAPAVLYELETLA
jgi:SAM-dependent methyltransferase